MGRSDDAPLLLTYSPPVRRELTSDEKERMVIKLWGMLYNLMPPKNVQEILEHSVILIQRITADIRK